MAKYDWFTWTCVDLNYISPVRSTGVNIYLSPSQLSFYWRLQDFNHSSVIYPPPPLDNYPWLELISFITGQYLDPWKHYTTKLSNLRHGTVTLIKIRPGKIEIPPFLGWIFYSHVYCSCHKQVSLYQHSLSHCHVYSPAMGLLWVFFICWFILLRFVKILSQREQGNFFAKVKWVPMSLQIWLSW